MLLPREGQEECWSGFSILGGGHPALHTCKASFSHKAHLKATAVSLEAANTVLPSPLCANPMLPLVATLAIFKAMLDSPSVALYNKAQVIEGGDYLAKRLATITVLVDKSTPTVVALFDTISHSKGGRWGGIGKTLLFDITCGL